MNIKDIKKVVVLLIMLVSSMFGPLASAASAGSAFSKGSTTLSFVAGSGSAFNDNYVILGVGAGYYMINGLELGLDVQHWFSGEPSITKISPQVKYVFTQIQDVKPYLGAFYRRAYIGDLDNENSYGYRAGAYFSGNRGVYIGGGIVYEAYVDCSRFIECSNTYPEILISINF